MSLARKLGSRFALLAGGRVAVLVLGLLATALLTRFLGPEGFGHFRTAVAFLGIAIALADLGLASLFVREISLPDADQRRLIGNALGLRLVLAGIAIAIAIGVAFVLPLHAQDRLGIVGGAFGFLAYSVHLLLFGLYQQKLRQEGVVLAEVTGGIVLALLILLFAWAGADPWWFATAMGLSYVFTLILTMIAAQRLVRFGLRLEPEVWWHLIKNGAPLAVVWTLSALYTRADTVLLAILHTPTEVGLYGVPVKIYDSLIGISLLFVGMFAPLLANTARRDATAFQAHLQNALATLAIGTIGIALGIMATAPELVRILAGPEFLDGVPVLRLMAGLLVVRGTTLMLRETVIALDIQQRLLPAYAATFVVAFAGYFILIPRLGGIGAVLAFLLAEAVLLTYIATIVIRTAATVAVLRVPLTVLACGLVTGSFVLWLDEGGYNFFLRAALTGGGYLGLLFATRALTVNTLLTFRREMLARKG
jgi:O-antigen/teichoic acid export membrane protein